MAKRDVLSAFTRLMHPRQALLVTCVDRDGKPNIIPIAWATPVSVNPPTVAISVKKTRYSHDLIKETGEFVINVPSIELVDLVKHCGSVSGASADKFSETGLTALPAKRVKPPVIGECIGHLECRVEGDVDAGDFTLFIGRVLAAYAEEECFRRNKWSLCEAKLLLHVGGNHYTTCTKEYLA